MQIVLDIDKLKLRAKQSGIPLKAICAKAGVSVATPARLKDGRGLVRTLTKLHLALMLLEGERRDHLASVAEHQEGVTL